MTKQMTDVEIAKKEVARQRKHREDNAHLFRESQDSLIKRRKDIATRLKDNKYV